MSRKTIAITIPSAEPAALAPTPDAGVESWVSQNAAAEPAAPTPEPQSAGLELRYQLSPTPNLAEATKILFVLPQAALLYWTLSAAKRSLAIAASFAQKP